MLHQYNCAVFAVLASANFLLNSLDHYHAGKVMVTHGYSVLSLNQNYPLLVDIDQ